MKPSTVIIGVAIELESGVICFMPPPARHHTILHALGYLPEKHSAEQGFLTNHGCFESRENALLIAREVAQIQRETAPQCGLFSEDLW